MARRVDRRHNRPVKKSLEVNRLQGILRGWAEKPKEQRNTEAIEKTRWQLFDLMGPDWNHWLNSEPDVRGMLSPDKGSSPRVHQPTGSRHRGSRRTTR